MATKKIILLLALLLMGCDTHRDLWVHSQATLRVRGDWMPSLGRDDMTGQATAMIYDEDGSVSSNFFSAPHHVDVAAQHGKHGVLVFNGLYMGGSLSSTDGAKSDIDLSGIDFMNTGNASTFEAVVEQATPSRRLSRAADEFIARNDMEILTRAWADVSIDSTGYARKYLDGGEQLTDPSNVDSLQVNVTPVPVSYYAQVLVHLTNPASAQVADGALRGFAGSVFMLSGLPSHMRATHQLKLDSLRLDPITLDDPTGTIESPVFVTFGPPTDLPADTTWSYEFELNIILKNGEVVNRTFDIKDQILEDIKAIKSGEFINSLALPLDINIGLSDTSEIELPVIDHSIGVDPWGDDEVIHVVIKP